MTKSEIFMIPNHKAAKLSRLDMMIANSVPSGGNWKNILLGVLSKRVGQIRDSYAQGKGSCSTYYGRLLPDMPAYTISTYFGRPENGCHIHYEQDRVLSQREAARSQSFPDDFIFFEGQTAINTQIGNVVPPSLAFLVTKEIEKAIGNTGYYIDLFSGAGGLGLGFRWAGWTPLSTNDIKEKYLQTYSNNVHKEVLCGSISDNETFLKIADKISRFRKLYFDKQLWVLGGPPCQGFSTAGNVKTMDDPRNSLSMYYKSLLNEVRPSGFIFENVAGLLNMEKGKVFERVKEEFSSTVKTMDGWILNSEHYAISQRRKRVILVGSNDPLSSIEPPQKLIEDKESWVSVKGTLSDLPPLQHDEDGNGKYYIHHPENGYQLFMRDNIIPSEYHGRNIKPSLQEGYVLLYKFFWD